METKTNTLNADEDVIVRFAEGCAEKLAPIFAIRGHWWASCGVPNQLDIRDNIIEHIKYLVEHPECESCGSGGIVVRRYVYTTEPLQHYVGVSYSIDEGCYPNE